MACGYKNVCYRFPTDNLKPSGQSAMPKAYRAWAAMVLLFLSPFVGRAAYHVQGSSGESCLRRRLFPERPWVTELAKRESAGDRGSKKRARRILS